MINTQIFPNAKHIYIECTLDEWKRQHMRFIDALDFGTAYNCEVPNSLRGEPHPQFTVEILGSKITLWVNRKKMTVECER